MIENILTWIDHQPAAYWTFAIGSSAAVVWAAITTGWTPRISPLPPVRRWLFPLLMLAVLLAWRWPYLLHPDEFNTDESQFIAGAHTLSHDPVFWRSVDGMTAGPLVYYALLPAVFLHPAMGYFFARLTGLLLIWLSLWICHRALRQNYGEGVARLGVLPGLLFIASVASEELNHYSSELVSLPLTALGLALLGRPPGRHHWFLAGVVTGLLPWVKLQAGPVGAALVAGGLVIIATDKHTAARDRLRHGLMLLGGTLVPAAVVVLAASLGGVWHDFWRSYVLQNLYYAGVELPAPWFLSHFLRTDPAGLGILAYVLTPVLLIMLAAGLGPKPSAFFRLSGLVFLAALFCVLFPHRNFPHYTMLLLVPLVAWGGAALGECSRRSTGHSKTFRVARAAVLTGVAVLLLTRAYTPAPAMIGQLRSHWRQPHGILDSVVAALTVKGEKLAVWGWHAQSYVTAGLVQGTRSAYTYWSIVDSPQRDFFREVFLADFQRSRPEVLIDSVGPNALFFQDRADCAHEIFPAFAEIVARDYSLVIDLGYTRVFARRDLLARRNITPTLVRQAIAAGRPLRWISQNLPREDLRRLPGKHHRIGGRDVLMMMPPAEAVWALQGDEREILFQCGYDPRALAQPEGNGTRFFVDLVGPDGTRRTVLSFLLDPQSDPADRGLQNRRTSLPPYEPGTKLVLRTDPGADNDDAWDWAYLTNVRFLRSPSYTFRQFPGFNRMPDFASSPLSSLVRRPGGNLVVLHAPAQLDYQLSSPMHRLQFAFGFLEGAYRGEHRTTGATFTVEAVTPDGTTLQLARRRLNPAEIRNDRGRQTMDIPLDTLPASSRLSICIDSDGSNAFDWTYITDLRLD